MIEVRVKIPYGPTENYDKLLRVAANLLGEDMEDVSTVEEYGEKYITARARGLSAVMNLFEGFRRQRIVQTARDVLFRAADFTDNRVTFWLHKQALYMKKFHFCNQYNESPLGAVEVTVISDNLERLLNYLVPMTEKGEPLEADYIPE